MRGILLLLLLVIAFGFGCSLGAVERLAESEINTGDLMNNVFFEDTAEWFYESEETKTKNPVRIEAKVGGLFTINYENGDQNMIAMVTMIKKNREVRLRGDCTIPQAFVANMTVKFEDLPTDSGAGVSPASGARVSVTHRMAGEFDDDLPAGFEEGWADGLEKLKSLVEAG